MQIERPRYIEEILLSGEYHRLLGTNSGKAVALLSGGIDSTVAMILAKNSGLEVIGLEFFYKGRSTQEATNVDKICKLTKIDLYTVVYPTILKKHPKNKLEEERVEIFENNSLYYSIAGGFAKEKGLDYIIGGQILDDWFNTQDESGTPSHYETLNKLLIREYKPNHPTILVPLIYLSKVEVIRIGLSLRAPLDLTWSCLRSNKSPCGSCIQCVERDKAFRIINNEG